MRRMGPDLFAYVVLTLLALWKLADWIAPWHGLTEAGCRIGYVYDGDTVELTCAQGRETARVQGLDAPETRSPRCPEELALGQRATERLRALVARGPVALSDLGHEKYGRRLIRLHVAGEDVAGVLTDEGLAELYQGDARPDWCARLGASR
jgi:endonuclease YncB( thermonuclease family)